MSTSAAAIFKANDIRGIYGDSLTDGLTRRIGQAIAAIAAVRGISTLAVGRDGRLSSPALAAALIEGLTAAGIHVLDIGLVPTPVLYYTAYTRCGGSGIMVTGSHNPKNYNGMKMVLDGKVLMGETMSKLRDTVLHDTAAAGNGGGTVSPLQPHSDYIAAVAAANPLARRLRVVLDAGNGAAGEYAPALFRALGCEVTALYCDIDGNFPNHHPDPAQPENLQDAANALADGGGDIAFIFDGDGDRLGVIPAGMPPVFADRLLMLYARDVLARQRDARVVFDVKCSALLAPWVVRHGGIADMQPTGHAFIKARMAETGALLGGEMSGHFYFRENWYGFDDALYAAARTAMILAAHPAAFTDIPDSIASPELHIDMSGRDQHGFVAELGQSIDIKWDFPAAGSILDIDGLRVEYPDGFGLVRASNTTPALVLRFEASDTAGLERIKADFRRVLLAADDTLPVNF